MPLQKLAFKPGVNRESTSYGNEGGYFASDKIRFRSGQVEKIGGWNKDYGTLSTDVGGVSTVIATPSYGTVWGIVRSLWNWITLSSYNLLALGSSLKFYLQNGTGGIYYDITPIRRTATSGVTFAAGYSTLSAAITSTTATTISVTLGTSFSSVGGVVLIDSEQIYFSGVSSNTLTGCTRGYNGTTAATHLISAAVGSYTLVVTDAGHGAQTYDFVTFSSVTGLGGLMTSTILNAEFQINYISNNAYAITASTYANASDTGTGGTPTAKYQINTGNDIFTYGVGWGAGGWGGSTGPSFTTTLSTINNGTFLTSAITSTGAFTMNVVSTSAFAASGSVWVESEKMTYTGKTATTLTISARGQGGTTAVTHTNFMPVVEHVTYITVAAAGTTPFAASGIITIDSEQIYYSAKFSATQFTVQYRGYNSTSATGHAVGTNIFQYPSTASGWGSATQSTGIGVQLRLWSQTNFGENLIFNARGGPLYWWDTNANAATFDRGLVVQAGTSITVSNGSSSTTVTPDAATPSLVNFVLVSDASRFVICFGANDPSAANTAQDPMLIRWSDQESFYTWIPTDTNQAGDYRLSRGSSIVAAIQTRQEILVLTDAAIYSMQYLGPPYVWGLQIMGDNISIVGPNAIAVANNIVYWMGLDKFYMYSGRVQTLPSTLREYVFTDINLEQAFQFFAGTNEGYNEVWWSYCSSGSTVVNRYVIYNYLDDVWYYGSWDNYQGVNSGRTAWLDSALRQYPMAVTYGAPSYTSNGVLVYHESGTDDNVTGTSTPILASITSSDFDIGDGHNFGFVYRLIPDLTFDGSNTNVPGATSVYPSCNFTVLPRTFPGANYGSSNNPPVTSAQAYNLNQKTYAIQQFTQQVYVRIRARQMAFQVSSGTSNSATDGLGTQWQMGMVRIDIRPDGRR